MKKFIVMMIAIVMALSLVACGKSDPAPVDQANTPAADISSEPDISQAEDKSDNSNSENKTKSKTDNEDKDTTEKVDKTEQKKEETKAADEDTGSATTSTKKSGSSSNTSTSKSSSSGSSSNTSTAKPNTSNTKSDSTSTKKSDSSSTKNSESKPTQPSKPSKPTEPSKPTQPSKPTEPSKPTHTHSYSTKTVAPTCSSKGYTLHTCSCGDSYKDSYKDALGHNWKAQYKTVTVDDYETIEVEICNGCGADLSELFASGQSQKVHYKQTGDTKCMGWHSEYKEVKVGSHTEKELTGYTCTRCGASK